MRLRSAKTLAAVQARLDAHGPTAEPRAAAELLRECREEAEDIAGWALLALTAVPEEERDLLLRRLAPVVLAAHQAWAAINRAQTAQGPAA